MTGDLPRAHSRESALMADEFYRSMNILLTARYTPEQIAVCREVGGLYRAALDREIGVLRSLGKSPEIDLAIERALEYRRILENQLQKLPTRDPLRK